MRTIKKIEIIAMTVLMAACSGQASKESEVTNGNAAAKDSENASIAKKYPVQTKKLEYTEIEKNLDLTADLVAYKSIDYAPASPGRIDKINVEIGSRVKKGDILVEIDKTQLNQAYTQLQSAKDNYTRLDTLYKLGSVSEQQYEQIKTQYDLAQQNVRFLSENTTLRSPIDGVVTGKYYEAGEMYSGAPNTAAGKAAVVSLMQINPIKAIVNVSESYFAQVKEGMTATVTSDVLNESFQGTIFRIHPTINNTSKTFQVEIAVDNNKEKLRPGMFSRISIKLGKTQAIVVPAIAILKQEGTNNRYVFIYENGKAKQVLVKIGNRFDSLVEILSDEIKLGQELIVEGQANLLNGSTVIKK